MNGTWRQQSLKIIDSVYCSIRLAQPDTVTHEQIMRMISRDYYPFGPRANFPYQAWLKAIRDYRDGYAKRELAQIDGPLFTDATEEKENISVNG